MDMVCTKVVTNNCKYICISDYMYYLAIICKCVLQTNVTGFAKRVMYAQL